jgi:hypothetical protein
MAKVRIAEVWTKIDVDKIKSLAKEKGVKVTVVKKKYPMGAYSYIIYKS